ncbi:MAG: TonB family protein [Gammaproteobacteria bacterium]
MLENYRARRLDGWGTSLLLHGVLGGFVLFAVMSSDRPLLPEPFRWQVALLSAAPAPPLAQPPAPMVQPQTAEPPPVQRRVVTPRPTVTRQDAPDVPAVTEATAPVQQQAVAPPAPDMEQAREPEAPPPPVEVDTGWLADLLWRRMEALKRYPYLARRNGWEGEVLIRAVIGADGRLLHAEIQQSSGHEALDQDALKVLRASTPLDLEQNLSWQQATLTIPVAYRLQR